MGTIVQEYGPIYGEVVNGTVSGRPNGSVYVPLSNTIQILNPGAFTTVGRTNSNRPTRVYTGVVKISAKAQDLSSQIQTQLYEDADCEIPAITFRTFASGIFNLSESYIGYSDSDLVQGQTYYFRAQLINNGVAIATTDVYELEGEAI